MYNCNVYDNPEHYGLTVWGRLDEEDLSYEYNMVAIWQHADGRMFYKQDSGCSCPSPFEDADSIEELTPLTSENYEQFITAFKDFNDKTKNELFARIREFFSK